MKLMIRKVGNSLGVILPKTALEAWGLGEGNTLELTNDAIRPKKRKRLSQRELDELKRNLALAVIRQFTAQEIRAQSLANLHRWKKQDAWVSDYDEWQDIVENGSDGELFAAMLGRDEQSNRLRQSPPYVGLLSQDEVRRLNEEAAA